MRNKNTACSSSRTYAVFFDADSGFLKMENVSPIIYFIARFTYIVCIHAYLALKLLYTRFVCTTRIEEGCGNKKEHLEMVFV